MGSLNKEPHMDLGVVTSYLILVSKCDFDQTSHKRINDNSFKNPIVVKETYNYNIISNLRNFLEIQNGVKTKFYKLYFVSWMQMQNRATC